MDIFNNLCRSCKTEQENVINIFSGGNKDATPSLVMMLEYCTGVAPSNHSKYSPFICFGCTKELAICYRFLKRYKESQKEFDNAHNIHLSKIKEIMQPTTDGETLKSHDARISKPVSRPSKMLHASISPTTTYGQENRFYIGNIALKNAEIPSALPCDECIKTFLTKKALQLHVKLYHKKPKSPQSFQCKGCEKIFLTSKALHLHLKLYHKQK